MSPIYHLNPILKTLNNSRNIKNTKKKDIAKNFKKDNHFEKKIEAF